MITISENSFRDYLFENHKKTLFSLISKRKDHEEWTGESFPPISFLLKQKTEKRINHIIDNLENLLLIAKELRLERTENHPTRVDLIGNSETSGITIIELKKSGQTERQAFTELLAYANHFCSIFPGLTESATTSILVAPMLSRTVKDAYTQELIVNNKNIISLIPKENGSSFELEIYYPEDSYYEWFENNILNDSSMMCVAISFPLIDGWIDSDLKGENKSLPPYTVNALNTVANSISHRLESDGFHSIVYANQKWGEIAHTFMYPNTIVITAMNPFSSFRTSITHNTVHGNSLEGRLYQVEALYNQMTEDGKEFWIETIEASFHNKLIRTVREQFELCFLNASEKIDKEISLPDWYGLKTSFIDAVFTHNLETYTTGLLREIHLEYIQHIMKKGEDEIYYSDDIPKYAYKMLTPFLPIWEIFRGLGHEADDEEIGEIDEDEIG